MMRAVILAVVVVALSVGAVGWRVLVFLGNEARCAAGVTPEATIDGCTGLAGSWFAGDCHLEGALNAGRK